MLFELYIILFSLLVWKCSLIGRLLFFIIFLLHTVIWLATSHFSNMFEISGWLLTFFKHVLRFLTGWYFYCMFNSVLSLVSGLPFFKHVLRFLIGWLFCYTFDAVLWLAACHFLNVFWDLWLAALYRRGDLTPVAAWLGPRPVSLSCPPIPTRPTDRTGSGGQSPPPVSGRLRQVSVASVSCHCMVSSVAHYFLFTSLTFRSANCPIMPPVCDKLE